MANKRITDVDFIDSLNSNESFFINQNNTLKQISKKDIVTGIGAMPTSGGMFTGDVGLLPNHGIGFFASGTNAEDFLEGAHIAMAANENGFFIGRFVDGAWVEDILKVNPATGEVIGGKLMPKSGGTFTGSISFAEGAEIIDANGNKLSDFVTYIATTVNNAMPKANFKFDATTGTLDITL